MDKSVEISPLCSCPIDNYEEMRLHSKFDVATKVTCTISNDTSEEVLVLIKASLFSIIVITVNDTSGID